LKAAILPTGSTEQHNEHLALVCDIASATLIAQQAALELYPRVIVAPPCPLGYAPYHMARKGTVTLRKETFLAYVFDVIKSLKAHGIRTILIVNGHGGNHRLLKDALPGWRSELGVTIDAESYWSGVSRDDREKYLKTASVPSHAAEFETSLLLAAFPERVRGFTMEEYDQAELNYESDLSPEVQEYLEPFGTRGTNKQDRARQEEALLATAEKGEALIAIATRFIAGRLQEMMAAAQAGTSWPPSQTTA
jgi:creatinine amidohydrolase